MEKNRAGKVDKKRDWAVQGGQGGLTETVMLQQQPEASERRSHVDTGVEWGRTLHAEGRASAKVLRGKSCWCLLGNVVGMGRAGVEQRRLGQREWQGGGLRGWGGWGTDCVDPCT